MIRVEHYTIDGYETTMPEVSRYDQTLLQDRTEPLYEPDLSYTLELPTPRSMDSLDDVTLDDVISLAEQQPFAIDGYLEQALDTIHGELEDAGFTVEQPSISYNPLSSDTDPSDRPAAQYSSRDDTIRVIRPSITDREYPLTGVIGHELMHKHLQQQASELYDRLEEHGLSDELDTSEGRYHLYGILAANDETTQEIIDDYMNTNDETETDPATELAEELEQRRTESPLPQVDLTGLEEGLCHTFTLVLEDRLDEVDDAYWENRAEMYEDDYDVPGQEIAHFGQQTTKTVRAYMEDGHDPMEAFHATIDDYWNSLTAFLESQS